MIEMKLTVATSWEASSASLPYLAEKSTVLLADGAQDDIASAVRSVPPSPMALNIATMTAGRTISFERATRNIFPSPKRFLNFACERNVPKTIIATGVCVFAMKSTGFETSSGSGIPKRKNGSPMSIAITPGLRMSFLASKPLSLSIRKTPWVKETTLNAITTAEQ